IYRSAPEAVDETVRFFETVNFSMEHLRYEYPDEVAEGYLDAHTALIDMAWKGAQDRYPEGIPEKVSASLKRELEIVGRMRYAPYFLTVADVVRFARSGF